MAEREFLFRDHPRLFSESLRLVHIWDTAFNSVLYFENHNTIKRSKYRMQAVSFQDTSHTPRPCWEEIVLFSNQIQLRYSKMLVSPTNCKIIINISFTTVR
jgi:hypothetical protein